MGWSDQMTGRTGDGATAPWLMGAGVCSRVRPQQSLRWSQPSQRGKWPVASQIPSCNCRDRLEEKDAGNPASRVEETKAVDALAVSGVFGLSVKLVEDSTAGLSDILGTDRKSTRLNSSHWE